MKYILFCLSLASAFSACSKQDRRPALVNLYPEKGGIGTTILLKGSGFGNNVSIVNVLFNGTTAIPVSINDTMIRVQVPAGATSGLVSVMINGLPKSDGRTFTLLSGTWVRKADLPFSPGRSYAAAFAINGNGYIVGGTDNPTIFNDVYEYDPMADHWTKKTTTSGPFVQLASCFVINNKAYVGISQVDSTHAKEWWEYDPPSDQWLRKADFPGPVGAGFSNFALGNFGYVVAAVDDFWMYDPVTDHWTKKSAVPVAVPGYVPSFFTIGTKAYTGNGSSGNAFWEYDPVADNWSHKSDFPGYGGLGIWYASGFTINSLGYVTAGVENWSFDPVNNSWSQVAGMGDSRTGAGSFVINGKAYFVGGGNGQVGIVNECWEFTP